MTSGTTESMRGAMRRSVRRAVVRLRDSRLWYRILWDHDRTVARVIRLLDRDESNSSDTTVVIGATGHGNIGDQAMLEAVLDNTPGEIVVILDSHSAAEIPERNRSRTTVMALPNLIDGQPWTRTRDVVRFVRLIRRCRRLRVIGADLMDGLYNPTGSIARSSCLRTGSDFGVEGRVLGFSWSDAAHPSARRALADAGPMVTCMAREPLSAERLRASGIPNVDSVADTVFTLDGTSPCAPFDEWFDGIADGRRIALVNMSALIGSRIDQTAEYRSILSELDRLGYAVALVPHVMRESGDDSHEIAKLSTADLPAGALVVTELLSPLQIRHIAGHADLVVTGRMHLAIMSIARGALPITLGTQGKVEGLYRLFRVGNLEIEPSIGFGARVVETIAEIDARLESLRELLDEDLPTVRALADRNFGADSVGDGGNRIVCAAPGEEKVVG